jgi:prepilin-type N-terminal cleavage/methylation domain-containing protein
MLKLQVQFKTRPNGFTLLELIVVVMIMSILAGIGGTVYVGTFERLNLDKAASNLLLIAKYARMLAIERQDRVLMCFDLRNNEFFLIATGIDQQTGEIVEEIIKDSFCKPVTLEGKIQFEKVQITSIALDEGSDYEDYQTIIFRPDGTAQTAMIQIGDENNHYTLSVIASTGKVKLYHDVMENIEATTVDLDSGTWSG